MSKLDEFTRAYVEAALWSSMDNADEQGGEPLDKNYGPDDIAPPTMRAMERACADFQARYGALIEDDDSKAIDKWGRWELAGHDFWLTSAGHGAGFGDGNYPKHDDELYEAAKSYEAFELYVGDDGLIYAVGHETEEPRVGEGKTPRFADVRSMLLDGLRQHGWVVATGLKVPHATSPNGQTRLWFKTQAVYMNDPGTDPRKFEYAHSLSFDMREYHSVDDLLAEVARRERVGEVDEASRRSLRVADFATLPDLVRHERDSGATHVAPLGKGASVFYPTGRYWGGGAPQYESGKVWQQGGYWHATAPGKRQALARGLPADAQPIDAYLGGSGRRAEAHRVAASREPTWVLPALATDGVTPQILEVVLDVVLDGMGEHAKIRPGQSVVYDRAYAWLRQNGYAVLKRATPGLSSGGDYFVLTDKGSDLVRRWRLEVRKVVTPTTARATRPRHPQQRRRR